MHDRILLGELVQSSPRKPCPVCGRTKDGDCRIKGDGDLVLCHRNYNHQQTGRFGAGDPENYLYLGPTEDGRCGKYVRKARGGKQTREFIYKTLDGYPVVKVTRMEDAEGKRFFQARWCNGNWVTGGIEQVKDRIHLYQIAKARRLSEQTGRPVFLVEGESCAEALLGLGIPATTALGGAGKWLKYGFPNYLEDLEGLAVVLAPDCDAPGLAHMNTVIQSLAERGIPIAGWLYAPPDAPWDCPPSSGGLDVVDWIERGATADQILGAVVQSNEKTNNSANKKIIKSGFIRLSKIEQIYDAPRQSLIRGLVDQGDIVLLSGKPGAGKSILALKLAEALASGTPFLGRDTTQQQVGIIQVDQSMRTTIGYTKRYVKNTSKENIFIFQPADGIFDLRVPAHRKHVVDTALEEGLKTIILDSWRLSIGDADENASTSVYPLACLKKELEPHNISLVIIHHANKMGDSRGSNALEGLVDVCLTLSTYSEPEKKNVRKLRCYKNRLNEIGEWDLAFDPETGEYNTAPTVPSSSPIQTAKQKSAQDLLDWFKAEAPDRSVEVSEILAALPISKSSAYAYLKSLTDQGLLLKKGKQWCLPKGGETSPIGLENLENGSKPLEGKIPDSRFQAPYKGLGKLESGKPCTDTKAQSKTVIPSLPTCYHGISPYDFDH